MSSAEPLRVAFLGNDPWSVPSLRAVASSRHEVVLVVTRVPRPAGRGSKLTPTAVAETARELELPLAEVETIGGGSGFDALSASAPDVLVVVAYGEILRDPVLTLAPLGAVNVHFSLLPALRGASPVRHALLQGLETTGVSTMLMDAGLDTGPTLLQAAERVHRDDDSGTLGARLAVLGAELLLRTLEDLAAGTLRPLPQGESGVSFAPKLGPETRTLDWSSDAGSLVRHVRAFAPEPGATTVFRGQRLKVLRAQSEAGEGEPGTVIAVEKDGFLLAAGGGAFRPLEVAPAGRRRMTAGEFVRGFHPAPGERLG